MTTWHVYILRCADDTLYCGITTDLVRRVSQHSAGTGAKYTRSRGPVTLATSVETTCKGDALRLEIQVKKQPRDHKISYLDMWDRKRAHLRQTLIPDRNQ
jgi:putative endonuclease